MMIFTKEPCYNDVLFSTQHTIHIRIKGYLRKEEENMEESTPDPADDPLRHSRLKDWASWAT